MPSSVCMLISAEATALRFPPPPRQMRPAARSGWGRRPASQPSICPVTAEAPLSCDAGGNGLLRHALDGGFAVPPATGSSSSVIPSGIPPSPDGGSQPLARFHGVPSAAALEDGAGQEASSGTRRRAEVRRPAKPRRSRELLRLLPVIGRLRIPHHRRIGEQGEALVRIILPEAPDSKPFRETKAVLPPLPGCTSQTSL